MLLHTKETGSILSSMLLRPAIINDKEILLYWRNDPDTRNMSVNHHIISDSEHSDWIEKSFTNPNRGIYIAEENGIPVGTFRIDEKKTFLLLSWTIAPEWRQKGLGKKMVTTIDIPKHKPWKAVIRKINIPSIKLARHLGMSVRKEAKDFFVFVKEGNE